MAEHNLDAVISPSYGWGSSAPACAGYPVISVPIGMASNGLPAGAWLYAGFLEEPQLLRIAYAMEELFQPRSQPEYPGAVPPDPPDAGLCPVTGPRAIAASAPRFSGPLHLATARRIEGLNAAGPAPVSTTARTAGEAPIGFTMDVPSSASKSTLLRFGLAESETVDLAIYNVRGECIATLLQDQIFPAGEHVAEWDGRDGGGRTVASGVYFCRLATDSATLTRRLLVVR
jgi:hypothetical protein